MDVVPYCCLSHAGKSLKGLTLVRTNVLLLWSVTFLFDITADHHYGRAVVMFGIPYVYTQSRILKVALGSDSSLLLFSD